MYCFQTDPCFNLNSICGLTSVFLNYLQNLTGGVNGGIHVTDVTNASRTMLMNIRTLQWDSELIE